MPWGPSWPDTTYTVKHDFELLILWSCVCFSAVMAMSRDSNKTATELVSDANTLRFIDYKLANSVIQQTATAGWGERSELYRVRGFKGKTARQGGTSFGIG